MWVKKRRFSFLNCSVYLLKTFFFGTKGIEFLIEKLNFLLFISLQPDGVNLNYFKFRKFYPTEFIV